MTGYPEVQVLGGVPHSLPDDRDSTPESKGRNDSVHDEQLQRVGDLKREKDYNRREAKGNRKFQIRKIKIEKQQ